MAKNRKGHRLHLLQGTEKGIGKLESLPPPVTKIWKLPKWVGKYGGEFHKAHWDYAASMETVTEADRASWFLLCQRYHRIRELEEAIDEYGPVVKGRSGEVKRNPAAASLKAELEAFRKERAVFGLDPEARDALGFKFPGAKERRPVMEDLID